MAARTLLRNWSLSAIAILSLSVAMAISVAGLSISDAVLLRPPLAQNPERLVTIHTVAKEGGNESFSYPDYEYIHDHASLFSGVAAFNYGMSKAIVTSGSHREFVWESVSDNYFAVMGIRPFLGQLFSPGDDRRKASPAVITYACWQRWGADQKIIGTTMSINSRTLTIIGVGPKDFNGAVFGLSADVIVPLSVASRDLANRDYRWILLVARTKPGVTRLQVRAEVQTLWKQLSNAYADVEKDRAVKVIDTTMMPPDLVQSARQVSALLIAAALLILLIACANVAGLLLALATRRRQEVLIKTAVGATRFQLISEFLKESALLCVVAGIVGYLMALAALRWGSSLDANLPVYGSFHLAADLHPGRLVFALTLGLIAIATFASGLAPALYGSSLNLAAGMGESRHAIRNAIVVIQVAVSTLALVGAGLCFGSLEKLRRVGPGFSARNLLDVMVPIDTEHLSHQQQLRAYDDLRQRASAIPGVEAVSLASQMALSGGLPEPVSFPHLTGNERTPISTMVVDEGYFSTLGVRVLSGRAFDSSDGEMSDPVIVINRYMAEKYWPRGDALGKAIRILDGNRLVKVVGIVENGKYEDLDEEPRAFFYYALNQRLWPSVTLIARTAGDPRRWSNPVVQMLRHDMPDGLPFPPSTWETHMDLALFFPKFVLNCTTGLSALALMLAIVGLYGAVSYSVSERRKELGIRVALGALPWQLFQLILVRTLVTAGIGVVAGLMLGVSASYLLVSQLYGIRPLEWEVLIPAAGVMLAVSTGIAYVAARPWIRTDAMEAVRHA